MQLQVWLATACPLEPSPLSAEQHEKKGLETRGLPATDVCCGTTKTVAAAEFRRMKKKTF
jgi:hypothetical protein